MLNKEQIYGIIDDVLSETKPYGAKVLVLSTGVGLSRFANSEIHQNVFEDKTEIIINILDQNKSIESATTDYSQEGLKILIAELKENLTFLPDGDAPTPLATGEEEIMADSFSEDLERLYTVENRCKLIKDCFDTLAENYMAYGALTYSEEQVAFGNSSGIRRFARYNGVELSALVSSDTGGTGYAQMLSNTPENIDVAVAFKRAKDKAEMNQNPIDIEPGAYTVILEPLAVGAILSDLAFMGFTGKSVLNQASFLTDRIGEQVFDEKITIIDDVTDKNTMPLPFDFEGEIRQVVPIIEHGIAKGLVYDGASAAQAGVKTTGHSVNMPEYGGMPMNMVMGNGEKTLDQIIRETESGLLITKFHYMNGLNPRQAQLTALTRDGLFKIENGEIVAAVNNMRFTESMLKAFNQVVDVSKERESTAFYFGNCFVPGIKINNFHFTGKTK
ncbi:MAG: metallopeptidase TldD-related protein [Eubacteriales bacterium]|nr:metallopeptidase TldD-related protein [Eubacteriales bacterium]